MRPEDIEDMEQYIALARLEGRRSKREFIEIDYFRQHWVSRAGVTKSETIFYGEDTWIPDKLLEPVVIHETSVFLPERFRDFVMSLNHRDLDKFWKLLFDEEEITHWEKYELKKKFKEYIFCDT